jgi:hypothetical protein
LTLDVGELVEVGNGVDASVAVSAKCRIMTNRTSDGAKPFHIYFTLAVGRD